jgi:hypothetical protein
VRDSTPGAATGGGHYAAAPTVGMKRGRSWPVGEKGTRKGAATGGGHYAAAPTVAMAMAPTRPMWQGGFGLYIQ